MADKINIVIQKKSDGYLVNFPELNTINYQYQSLEDVLIRLKNTLESYLSSSDISQKDTTGESILKIVDKLTDDFTQEELEQLPEDGAEEHNYYLYGTPKKNR
ncbi:conserved hypothetical protein [Gloeothece citriformis PCC 7424]|uniref:HicB-like antitoxin of toxin-antitoxin system domain-containing protein n=1 Tax=Gloeothece citriformis (strain PCC 7424) TaxID=65393 RepID=B7KBQ2_GLOC7|nr:hypothetical protein [Gloeothece citriformis]ACK73030.1 conserved hypothetical protein [Gloeothece citriformis PCC 7424]